jgi:hypothetical protein
MIETPSRPRSVAAPPRGFALIARAARAHASYPRCLSVYPLDSLSRVFYVAHPIRSILNSSFSLVMRRPAVRCIAWLDLLRAMDERITPLFVLLEHRRIVEHANRWGLWV